MKDITETSRKKPIEHTLDAPRRFAARTMQSITVPDRVREGLARPQRVQRFAVPLERDDGSVDLLDGFRVHHDDARGPFLGPHRYHPDLDADACAGLATALTWTAAVADVPFGGSAGGVRVDPSTLSRVERTRLTRSYADRIADDVGPDREILTPDAGTDALTMARFADRVGDRVDGPSRATVVGKPPAVGGPDGVESIAGRGVALAAQEILEFEGESLVDATVAVYGYGNVGATAADLLDAWGGTVVAACDDRGGVVDPDGLATEEAPRSRDRAPALAAEGGTAVDPELVLARDVDLLVLAAPGEVLTAENADDVDASIVIEGTYGGVTPDAQRTLDDRGVVVAPDVLANVGSVVAAHLEWVQDVGRDHLSRARVENEIGYALVDAWDEVRTRRAAYDETWREAAYALALSRVVAAHEVVR